MVRDFNNRFLMLDLESEFIAFIFVFSKNNILVNQREKILVNQREREKITYLLNGNVTKREIEIIWLHSLCIYLTRVIRLN